MQLLLPECAYSNQTTQPLAQKLVTFMFHIVKKTLHLHISISLRY
jgi:hypothetical protein